MLTTLATALLATLPVQQDTIVLTDGRVLTELRIQSETYKEVTFRRGSADGRRDADKVLEVRHDLSSSKLERYARAVEQMDTEGDFAQAASYFGDVLEDEDLLNDRRYGWVRQHARWRRIRCLNSLGDFRALAAEVDQLLSEVPDTFYYAPALIMKAEGLAASGDKKGARGVYQQLDQEILSKGLPDRWAREAELGLALLDDALKGAAKQRKLQGLAEKNASTYPTVANRARVEVGNAMVEAGDFRNARSFFQSILDSGSAGSMTMAAALSGIGDCAYQQGLAAQGGDGARALFEEAALAHLQVAAYYKEATRLRARSMFHAGDAIYRAGGENARTEAQDIARKALQAFPNSPWTEKLFAALQLQMPSR